MRLGHTLPDGIGGLVGALAALRALRRRLAFGVSGWFDISQLEAYVAISGEDFVSLAQSSSFQNRVGNRSRGDAVQGIFPCLGRDQWIAIRLESHDDCCQFEKATGVVIDPVEDADVQENLIASFSAGCDKEVLAKQLQAAGLEAFPVLDAFELLENSQLSERQFFLNIPVNKQAYGIPGKPFHAAPALSSARVCVPRLGEHNKELIAE